MKMATRKLCLQWGAAMLAACVALAPEAPGQAAGKYEPPRTAEGRPDFQGTWTSRWSTPLERPAWEARLELSKEEAGPSSAQVMAARRRGNAETSVRDPNAGVDITGLLVIGGMARSSVIVDPASGSVPYTKEGLERRSKLTFNGNAGDEAAERRGPTERCIGANAGFAPFMPMPSGNIRQIVQTRDHVTVLTESFSQLRIIPFERYGAAGRGGASSARWEGDTLVVRTRGYAAGDNTRAGIGGFFVSTPSTEITERFMRIGPDEILYRFSVEDPTLYTQAWTGESLLKRTDERMYEFACHEGNYSMASILRAARMAEARQVQKE